MELIKKITFLSAFLVISYSNLLYSQIDSSFFLPNQHPEMMLSGFGFNNSGGDTIFNHCAGIASDGTRLFVADRWNNRILIWNSLPQSNVAPDLVLGQKDFNTNNPGNGLDQFNWPGAISASSDGKLVIADTYNDRILVWNTIPTQNGQAADFAITSKVSWPWGVWTNGQKLVISNALINVNQAKGIMIWNTFPTSNSTAPDFSLTANGNFGTPRTITSNGDFLMVGDHNSKTSNGPQGNFVWTAFPQSDISYDYFTTDPEDHMYAWLQGSISSNNMLVVLGRRLHIWKTLPGNATQKPDISLNYSFNGGDGSDVVVIGTQIFVSCMNDNRVFVFNSIPTDSLAQPSFVLGSPDVKTNTLKTAHFITNPVPASDGKHLFVSSDFDKTLSVWKNIPKVSATPPDTIMSLQEAPWDNELKGDTLILAGKKTIYIWKSLPLNGQQPDIIIQGNIGNTYFEEIKGVAIDDQYFYIVDRKGYMYVWNGMPTSSSYADPIYTIPVTSPTRLSSNGQYLCVTEMEANPPVSLLYEVATLSNNAVPFKTIIGQNGYSFNLPMHSLLANGHFFLANTINNVIYAWKDMDDAGDYSKVIVLGSDSPIETTPSIGESTLFWPSAMSFDGEHLWVGEYKFSGRILRYTIPTSLTGTREAIPGKNEVENIEVYPNPASNEIYISIPDKINEEIEVSLFDCRGENLKNWHFNTSNFQTIKLNKISAGIYQMRIVSQSISVSKKIVITN